MRKIESSWYYKLFIREYWILLLITIGIQNRWKKLTKVA